MAFLPMARIAARNLFSRPATRRYPSVIRPPFAATRGRIEIDFPSCVLCGVCAKRCPAGSIAVDRAGGSWSIDRFSCVTCGLCVRVCFKNSLSMRGERAPSLPPGAVEGRLETRVRRKAGSD